jgi:hypothetical protein
LLELKPETVIIEKIPLKLPNTVSEITPDMAGKHGIDCQEMFSPNAITDPSSCVQK